jgi:hypothetical protein
VPRVVSPPSAALSRRSRQAILPYMAIPFSCILLQPLPRCMYYLAKLLLQRTHFSQPLSHRGLPVESTTVLLPTERTQGKACRYIYYILRQRQGNTPSPPSQPLRSRQLVLVALGLGGGPASAAGAGWATGAASTTAVAGSPAQSLKGGSAAVSQAHATGAGNTPPSPGRCTTTGRCTQ